MSDVATWSYLHFKKVVLTTELERVFKCTVLEVGKVGWRPLQSSICEIMAAWANLEEIKMARCGWI